MEEKYITVTRMVQGEPEHYGASPPAATPADFLFEISRLREARPLPDDEAGNAYYELLIDGLDGEAEMITCLGEFLALFRHLESIDLRYELNEE